MNAQLNVLFVTADQFRGDCLSARRAPGRAHARTSIGSPPAGSRSGATSPTRRRAGRAGRPLHGHVPVQPPGRDQRLPARRPVHELRPRGARRSATSPRCSATPTSASTPARSPPTIRACAPTKACSPASTRSCHLPEGDPAALARLVAKAGLRRPRQTGASSSTSPPTGPRWRTQYDAEHTQTAFLTDRVLDFVDDHATRPVVRAPLVPAAAPAVPRARALRHDVRPRVGSGAGARRVTRRRRRSSIRCSA